MRELMVPQTFLVDKFSSKVLRFQEKITCSKLTIETLKQGVKHLHS